MMQINKPNQIQSESMQKVIEWVENERLQYRCIEPDLIVIVGAVKYRPSLGTIKVTWEDNERQEKGMESLACVLNEEQMYGNKLHWRAIDPPAGYEPFSGKYIDLNKSCPFVSIII